MNIFIVENSGIAREALQSELSDVPEVKVVGHSVDEQDAIKRIRVLQPDVVILDLSLQSGLGISVLENIKKCHATIKVIVFFSGSFQFVQIHNVLRKWAHTGCLDSMFRPGIDTLQVAG